MKTIIIAVTLLISSTAFSAGRTGEVQNTSGTSTACCPTGGCLDKNLPICAGVVQRTNNAKADLGRKSSPGRRGKTSKTSQQ